VTDAPVDFFEYIDRDVKPDFEDKDFLFDVFCRFGTLQVYSWDIDPTYPVLRKIYDMEGISPNNRLWRTFLYVTFYSLGSSYRVWDKHPEPCLPPPEDLREPTGIERRGFRARPDLVQKHIQAALDATNGGDFLGWVQSYGTGEDGWNNARDAMRSLPWGGNWSAYKWADLLAATHDVALTAPDFGVGGGGATAGPIPGMVILTGHPWEKCAKDIDLQRDLYERCVKAGVPFKGMDQVETSLCDFNSLCKGRFYVGHDVDSQMEHFKKGGVPPLFWEARSAIPDEYRGEKRDWFGVRKSLKRDFADKSIVEPKWLTL
jgi:hypothetical protein